MDKSLDKMKLSTLKELATDLGLKTSGVNKKTLLTRIETIQTIQDSSKMKSCYNKEELNESKEIFKKIKTFDQFLETWAKFYTNEICIPGYYGTFIDNKKTSDARRDAELIAKDMVDLTLRGRIIMFQSQESMHSSNIMQKEFLQFYCPIRYVQIYLDTLNSCNNILAFAAHPEGKIKIPVTMTKREKTGWNGEWKGVTWIHGESNPDEKDFILEWLTFVPPEFESWIEITVINTNYKENSIIPCMKKAVDIVDKKRTGFWT